jgi:large subunit ribosomal protein L54
MQIARRLFQSQRRLQSSCPKGTVLKGINVFQGKKDPVAMDDSEYPEWLFKLLEKPVEQPEDKMSISHLRKLSKATIVRNSLTK